MWKFGQRELGMRSLSGERRLAIVCTMAVAGWAGLGASMYAQVVKAPRYQGGVEAPSPQLVLPPVPTAITPHGTVVEDVVARVNDQIITRSDVERAEAQLVQDAQQNHMGAGDLAVAQRDMLRDMIDEQLLLSKAKQLDLNADADVVRKLDEIRKQNHMDSLDDLKKAAEAQGVNYEDFKAQIRNGILKQDVVREEVGRKLQLSDSDETAYYKAHEKDFEQPEQVRLSEILVPLTENATPAEVSQAEAKANDLKSQLMKGADFAELAKKYSGGQTAAQGGELGQFKRGTLAQVLEDQTFPLPPGQTTQPIRTRQGLVILKVTEHTQAGPAPMKDVEPQIQEAIYMQQMQPALREYLTKLREDSYVNLAQGFVDSGASGNETVPQFTAYVPPAVKKKKPKETERFGGNARYQAASAKNGTGKVVTATAAIDPKTGMAMVAAPKTAVGKNGKPKKIKKEKIRFGQAPRTALQSGGTEDADATATTPVTAAPGAIMASAGTAAAVATNSVPESDTNLDENPLNAKAPEAKKTRFASKEPVVKEKKIKAIAAKKADKIVATAAPASAEEKADTKQQAAPLGLNGDTVANAKKAKKDAKKRVKGAPKERLAEKPVTKPTPAPAPALTANPKLAPTDVSNEPTQRQTPPNSATPKSVPSQSDTTLPPATQPPPGSPEQGQPVPGTNPPN